NDGICRSTDRVQKYFARRDLPVADVRQVQRTGEATDQIRRSGRRSALAGETQARQTGHQTAGCVSGRTYRQRLFPSEPRYVDQAFFRGALPNSDWAEFRTAPPRTADENLPYDFLLPSFLTVSLRS